MLKLVFITSV